MFVAKPTKPTKPTKPAPAFEPYLVSDPYAMVRGPWLGKWLVLGPCALGALRAVGRVAHMEGVSVGVVDRVLLPHHVPNYRRIDDENSSLQSILEGVKKEALEHGATPLAVQWLSQWLEFEPKEMNVMAEKLKTKAAKPAAEKTAKKGNPEALAKAREARASAAQEDRKYKTLVKRGDIKTREGTWTEAMVDIIMSNKSTDAAKAELASHKEFSERRLDFSWAEKKGYISF